MPSDGDILLRNVLTTPEDTTARLVYADYLEEHGEPAKAEFVRLQTVTIPQTIAAGICGNCGVCSVHKSRINSKCPLHTPVEREYGLLAAHRVVWWGLPQLRLREEIEAANRTHIGCCDRHADNMACDCHQTAVVAAFDRGFVASVGLPAAAFVQHAGAIFSRHPVTVVALHGLYPLEWSPDAGSSSFDQPTYYSWVDETSRGSGSTASTYYVPAPVFAVMCLLPGARRHPINRALRYDSGAAALAALSAGAVAYGRAQAGLPPLNRSLE